MSVACGIAWRGEVPRLFSVDDCTAIVRCGVIDRDPGAGLRPLSAFFSISPEQAQAEYEGYAESDPGELPAINFPPEEFFPSQEGLATVRAHLQYFSANPADRPDVPAILDELRDFERVLAALVAENTPFHLTIIP